MKKNKKIIYKNFINNENLKSKITKKLDRNFSKLFNNIYLNLDSTKDAFHSLSKNFKLNFNINSLQKFKKYNKVAIIGMGGSILGAEAIYSFLKKKIKKDFIFLNNINEDDIMRLQKYSIKKKMLFIVISKSGNTTETIANCLSLNILKSKSKNLILISEEGNNSIYKISKKLNLFHIQHRKYIGGRYSVLSEVGLLPAYLMGLNLKKLRKNLLTHFLPKNKKILKDSVIKVTNILENKKIKNLILLNYNPILDKFLFWYQQLAAESLGKSNKGFLPTISSAPKDHHSLLQLYLDGPKDKIFYIFHVKVNKAQKLNPKIFSKDFYFLKNKSLPQIRLAQKNAFIKSLKKKGIPFREFLINDISEETLGELFSYFILETATIGLLANINPFNQPSVEQVKIDTKKLLS